MWNLNPRRAGRPHWCRKRSPPAGSLLGDRRFLALTRWRLGRAARSFRGATLGLVLFHRRRGGGGDIRSERAADHFGPVQNGFGEAADKAGVPAQHLCKIGHTFPLRNSSITRFAV